MHFISIINFEVTIDILLSRFSLHLLNKSTTRNTLVVILQAHVAISKPKLITLVTARSCIAYTHPTSDRRFTMALSVRLPRDPFPANQPSCRRSIINQCNCTFLSQMTSTRRSMTTVNLFKKNFSSKKILPILGAYTECMKEVLTKVGEETS